MFTRKKIIQNITDSYVVLKYCYDKFEQQEIRSPIPYVAVYNVNQEELSTVSSKSFNVLLNKMSNHGLIERVGDEVKYFIYKVTEKGERHLALISSFISDEPEEDLIQMYSDSEFFDNLMLLEICLSFEIGGKHARSDVLNKLKYEFAKNNRDFDYDFAFQRLKEFQRQGLLEGSDSVIRIGGTCVRYIENFFELDNPAAMTTNNYNLNNINDSAIAFGNNNTQTINQVYSENPGLEEAVKELTAAIQAKNKSKVASLVEKIWGYVGKIGVGVAAKLVASAILAG